MKRPMFSESGEFVDDGEPIFLSGKVTGGTPKFHNMRTDTLALCQDKESPIAQMVKDRAMYNQIQKGNGSDKSLKRDAEYLQTNYQTTKKAAQKRERFKRVEKAREKYKRKYKADPI